MIEFCNELSGSVIVRILEKGEDVFEAIKETAEKNNIKSGIFNMIGAVSKAVIGYFDVKMKDYRKIVLEKDMELVSCIGNITKREDGSTVVHAHIALADEEGNVYGGHLFPGTIIGVTGELFIFPFKKRIIRKFDDKTNLYLIKEQQEL